MGILVTRAALRKNESDELNAGLRSRRLRHGGMALCANNLLVRSGQTKLRRRVIEPAYILPFRSGVAVLAPAAKLTFVLVFVAASAIATEAKVTSSQILHQN